MTEELPIPKVFISYSWTPEEDKELVKNIADRLINECRIDVMLDRYNLKPGDDKYAYMESMVTDKTIDKVLIFSNKIYTEKANNRESGVGTESTIISQEIYSKVKQNKFIPILLQRDENGEPYFPVFMKSRIYIDFSDPYKREDEFEKLVRFIYNEPLDVKPELGQIPKYITEKNPVKRIQHFKIERIKAAVTEGKPNAKILIEDYLENFLEEMSKLKIEDDTRNLPHDQKIYDMILETKQFRNNFLEFFEYMIKSPFEDYIEMLHKHIESWSDLIALEDNYYNADKTRRCSQHYKFFFKELFQYIITIALKKDKFNLVAYLINTLYWVKNSTTERENRNFTFLYNHINSLDDERKRRLNDRQKSNATDLLVQRIDYKNIKFIDMQETDRLLHYLSLLSEPKSFWFPYLTMYDISGINLMKRAESLIFFNKIKPIFNVNGIDELKVKINGIGKSKREYYDHDYNLNDIESGLNINYLGTRL